MHSLQWSGLYIFFSPSLHESGFKRVITCPWQFRDPKLKMLMNVDVRVPALEFTLKLKKEDKGNAYQFISSKSESRIFLSYGENVIIIRLSEMDLSIPTICPNSFLDKSWKWEYYKLKIHACKCSKSKSNGHSFLADSE